MRDQSSQMGKMERRISQTQTEKKSRHSSEQHQSRVKYCGDHKIVSVFEQSKKAPKPWIPLALSSRLSCEMQSLSMKTTTGLRINPRKRCQKHKTKKKTNQGMKRVQMAGGTRPSPIRLPQTTATTSDVMVALRRLKIQSNVRNFNQREDCQSWLMNVANSLTTKLKL